MEQNEKKLFLLDAYALIFRAYYAMISSPRMTSRGENTSAVFGFLNTLAEVLDKEKPTHIAVCIDPSGPTFRHQAYEGYKAEREATPEGIRWAVPHIKELMRAMRIPVIEVPGYEADDVIGTLSRKARQAGFTTYMMSPDKDFGQLVTDGVYIFRPGWRGEDAEVRGVKEVCAKYGIDSPLQVIDLLALMGDKADNIPGCPGVGEKTAVKLLKQFGSVEEMLARTGEIKGALRAKVEASAEQIRFSKYMATIVTDVPVEFDEELMRRHEPDGEALLAELDRLEFRTFIKRFFGEGAGKQATAPPKQSLSPGSGQRSLWDFGEDSEDICDDAPQPAAAVEAAVYTTALERAEVDKAFGHLGGAGDIAMHIVATEGDTMQAQIVGIALTGSPGRATYIPIPPMGEEREHIFSSLKSLFATGGTTLVSADVKRDIILLRNAGVAIPASYFDIAVAHYVVQPEMSHTVEHLALVHLGVELTALSSLTGPRGRGYTPVLSLDEEALTEYACSRADCVLRLKPVMERLIEDEAVRRLLYDVELPLIKVLADMEITGVRVDVKSLKSYSRTLTEQLSHIEAQCYELAGERFNPNSPAQVGEILFDHLKLDPKARRTRNGSYSTTEEVLAKLKSRHPLVGKILELRGLRKLLSTYVNALPELINPATGRIHTTYNQTVTATGRLSSTNPNMQNIPVRNEEGREIRRAFIPAEGNVFFSADYSQIELRLVADFSGDSTMVDAFIAGDDIHAITAARIYHTDPQSVTPDQRRKAKTANFGILYGISAFGLSERLEIPRTEAKELIDSYFATFPGVKAYIDATIATAREKGYVATKFGRRRMLPDINSKNAVVRGFSERNAVNAPIQGTAADVIKIAMVRIYRRFAQEGLRSKMIMQVHDELNFDVVPAELDRVAAIVSAEMQGAYNGSVPLTASTGSAQNWLLAH